MSFKDYIPFAEAHTLHQATIRRYKLDGPELDIPKIKGYPFGIGIEVEVEGITQSIGPEIMGNCWLIHNDGSLRDGGMEFVSYKLNEENVIPCLDVLHRELTKNQPNHVFSERTSVHIHTDCRTFTLQNLVSLLLVYVTVERLLFNFAGAHRFNSIYCVPSCIGMAHQIIPKIISMEENNFFNGPNERLARVFGNHYSALNIDNLVLARRQGGDRAYGTIEFRHMKGNIDIQYIKNWIEIIERLKVYAITTGIDKIKAWLKDINTTSYYREYLEEIFGPLTKVLIGDLPLGVIQNEISENVSIAKTWFHDIKPINGNKFLKSAMAKRIQGTLFSEQKEKPPRREEDHDDYLVGIERNQEEDQEHEEDRRREEEEREQQVDIAPAHEGREEVRLIRQPRAPRIPLENMYTNVTLNDVLTRNIEREV